MRATSIRALAVLAILVCGTFFVAAGEPRYKLGPGDRVRVRASEWRAARGEVFEWDALAGEFTVNDQGAVSMPLLGEVRAAGLGTGELAQAISDQLQRKVGVVQRPESSVEIISYRPFYIVGGVNKPGEFQFRPGVTVLQAIGIAGGYYRPAEWRLQREAISSEGELRVLDLGRDALLARKARLEAELAGASVIKFPPALLAAVSDTKVSLFIQQEQSIFNARLQNVRSQTEALEQLKVLLNKEIDSLREKSAVQDRQIALARKELELVSSLASKGLTVNSRQLSLEQASAQMESARLDLTVGMLRAQEDLSKANRDILTLHNKRRDESATDLKETQLKIEEFEQKAKTAGQLASESTAEGRSESLPVLSIVRRGEGGVTETVVAEDASVVPGDVIRVRIPLQSRRGEAGSAERGAGQLSLPRG